MKLPLVAAALGECSLHSLGTQPVTLSHPLVLETLHSCLAVARARSTATPDKVWNRVAGTSAVCLMLASLSSPSGEGPSILQQQGDARGLYSLGRPRRPARGLRLSGRGRGMVLLASTEDPLESRVEGRADYAPAAGYRYAGGLPPDEWGYNFDGKDFIEPFSYVNGGIVDEPSMDGDYWLAATGDDPSVELPLSEDLGPRFGDMHWNDFIWCGSAMCDYTSPATYSYPDEPYRADDWSPGMGMRPL